MTAKVLVSGMNVVDLLFTLPDNVKKDSKHQVDNILLQGGAPAGNAASVMATLGLETHFLGYKSESTLGVVADAELKRCGVDTSYMRTHPTHTPAIALVEIDANSGERTVFYSVKGYQQLSLKDVDTNLLKSSQLLFVDGYDIDINLQLLKLAKQYGIPSVIDIESGDKALLSEMLALASHSILPLNCAQFLSDQHAAEDCIEALKKISSKQIVITDGVNGSWANDLDNTLQNNQQNKNETIHQSVFPTTVVDTTGCGDAFHGAYSFALLQGKSLRDRMVFASAYAAIIAQHVGGRTYHPTASEVETFISEAAERNKIDVAKHA